MERELSRAFPYIAISSRCLKDTGDPARKYCLTDPKDGGGVAIAPGCSEGCNECYVEVPYEEAGHLIIGEGGIIRCGFMLTWDDSKESILVGEGVAAHVIELEGYRIHSMVSEGSRVARGDKIAYIATKKGEVRSVRSGFDGLVVYAAQKPESRPERFLFIVVGEDHVRRARIVRN